MPKRLTIEDCQRLAAEKGGEYLATEYKNAFIKYPWKCKKGHIWEACFNNIQQGHWCPCCAKCIKHTLEDCQKLAESRGGKCLDTVYINNHTKMGWECSEKHQWKANFGNVKYGRWCPYCVHLHSKPELELYEFIRKSYPDALNGKTKLLKNKRFELDVYVPSLNKAIELDGIYWHGLPGSKERDLRKNQQCEEAGIKLLRMKESDWKNDQELVKQQVLEFLSK